VDAGAGVDHRPLGPQDGSRRLAHIGRVGTVFVDADRRVVDVTDLLVPDIGRDLDDRGAATAVANGAEGATQDVLHLGRKGDRFGDLGYAAHFPHGAVVRVDMRNAAGIALRDDQHRDRLGVGLGDAAIGVLGARAVLHAESTDLAARGDAGDRVRHVQANPLLPHDDRANIRRRGELQQMIDGIAAKDFDPLTLHNLSDSLTDLHPLILSNSWVPLTGGTSWSGAPYRDGTTRLVVWQPPV
jgi:hypothetical protein